MITTLLNQSIKTFLTFLTLTKTHTLPSPYTLSMYTKFHRGKW